MSRILVTGATGFIGSAIFRRLAEIGHEPIAMEGDLLTAGPDKLLAVRPTHCIHAAWYTNHSDYLTNDINRDWIKASLWLAEKFFDAGGQRFVGLGTCLEYDLGKANRPFSEDETPLRPQSLYAQCKFELAEALHQRFDGVAWARIFFVYGPGDRPGRLVPHLIERFSKGEKAGPTHGALRRDYIHVDDLADQLVRIALSNVRGAINVGTGLAPSLSEIFAVGAQAFHRPELALSNNETGGLPPLIQANMGRFRENIGEPAARDISTGLKDLIG